MHVSGHTLKALQKISVIIPCRNGATTLTECLDSVIGQTYRNLEVIFINDGSTDETQEKVETYQTQHKSLSILLLKNKKSLGVSNARNKGLEHATGEYISFLDSDDTLEADFCERLLAFANKNSLDIACCNALKTGGSCKKDYFPHFPGYKIGVADDILTNKAQQAYFDSSWCKLYRREMLRKNALVFRTDMTFGEDTLFATQAALCSDRIGILGDYSGYLYHISDQSSSAKTDVRSRLQNLATLLRELKKELSQETLSLLLRKSQEYLWTIRKFGGKERTALLQTLMQSELWKEVLFPVISLHGKWKHRIIAKALQNKHFCLFHFW